MKSRKLMEKWRRKNKQWGQVFILDKYTEDIAVDGSLIQKELGFVPQYDLKTGWEETVKEMPR